MEFNELAKQKFVENLLSVKVWIVFSVLILSSLFLYLGLLTGAVWGSVNGGVISTICALREAFKVARVRSTDDTTNMMV